MKRSNRQVKPNSKYFDTSFKSPKLDIMLKKNQPFPIMDDADGVTNGASGDFIAVGDNANDEEMHVDVVEDMEITDANDVVDGPMKTMVKKEANKAQAKTTEGKSISPTSGLNQMVVKDESPEHKESTQSAAAARSRPTRQPKPSKKFLEAAQDTFLTEEVKCEVTQKKSVMDGSKVEADSSSKPDVVPERRNRPRVQVKPKQEETDDDEDPCEEEEPKRPCRIAGCPAVAPMCFAGISERCTGNKYTSRWNHISAGEHFCNACFEYLRGKRGATGFRDDIWKEYETWNAVWSSKARRPSSISGFLVDKTLSYWARCNTCSKWRQLPRGFNLTHDVLKGFTCAVMAARGNKVKQKDLDRACETPEDTRVDSIRNSEKFYVSRPTAGLKQSPAAPFLTKYYPDGVGLSPTEATQCITKVEKKKLCKYVVPFAKENRPLHAFGVAPDMMLETEIAEFRDMVNDCPQLYLGLRNMALTLWMLNPKEWLTAEKVEHHVVCRGLVRISLVERIPRLLSFLTRHGYINQGFVSPPPDAVVKVQDPERSTVLVIGAGASGLAAAYCLNSHGVKVTVLEAKSHIGGRVGGTWTSDLGVSEHCGQLVNGCWNNPIALMAYQSGLVLPSQSDNCPLLTSQGQLVPEDLDRRIEFHYNAILDIVSDWRKGRGAEVDVPLKEKFKEFHEEFIRETQGYFSETAFSQQEVRRLVNFYLSNLEFATGCSLNQCSTLYWDQNEDLPQLGGAHVLVPGGFGSILDRLADDLDVRLDCEVNKINYSGDKIEVYSSRGLFTADKVIVTIPLAVLQKDLITFNPPLPESKVKAIKSLGAGQVEKVTFQFASDFWSEKLSGHSLFGHVPETDEQMGYFNVFYCHHHEETNSHFVSSHLVGRGLDLMKDKTDEEIVEACLKVLSSLFPEKAIPQPTASSVSRWSDDKHIGMAYSHIPVGASGDTYDEMASSVNGCLHFAGEATNRQFPQSVTGAYISGVREAWNVLDDLST